MKKWWFNSLVLSLGLAASTAYAADPAPATLDRPVIAASGPVAAPNATPAVVLERPVGVGQPAESPILDRQIRPTSYETSGAVLPMYRGQMPDPIVARPLPVGSPASNPNTALHTWRRPGEGDPAPEVAPPPTKVTPPTPAASLAMPAPAPTPSITTGIVSSDGGSFLSRFTHFGRFGVGSADECDGCPAGVDCPADCGVDCCGRGGFCPSNRWYVSAEYLLWWFKGQSVPPLVTSGSLDDRPSGALGLPGTNTLFGGRDMENGAHSGARFMFGYWCGDDHRLGIEAGYFFLAPGVTNFTASSPGTVGSPILSRPFVDADTGLQSAEGVAGFNRLAGTVSVQTRSSLWGAEANLRSTVWCNCTSYIDLLAGFRTLGLDEDLIVRENLTVLNDFTQNGVLIRKGSTFDIVDHFQTRNRFYGGQVGAEWQRRQGRWDVDVKTKIAVGSTQQMVNISGVDVITDPVSGTRSFNGGLLAQQSNIGSYSRNRFTYVPEIGLTVGYHVTDHLRAFAGYNFLYWSSVARPGPQIDRTVNQNQLAPPGPGGAARPAFSFNGTDFWAQGVNIGLEYKW